MRCDSDTICLSLVSSSRRMARVSSCARWLIVRSTGKLALPLLLGVVLGRLYFPSHSHGIRICDVTTRCANKCSIVTTMNGYGEVELGTAPALA
jgi:hypothetical protein